MADENPNPYQPPQSNGAIQNSLSNVEPADSTYVLSGCLTVKDVLAVNRLITHRFWPRLIFAALLISVFTIVLIAVAVSSRPFSQEASNVMLLVACVIIPALIVTPLLFKRWRLHRFARNQYGLFAPSNTTFSTAGIVAKSEGAKAEMQWALFSHCIANDSVAVLVYKNSNQILVLGKSTLITPDRWEALIAMAHTCLATANAPSTAS